MKIVTLCLECCNHSNLPAFTCGMHSPQVSSVHSLLTGRGCRCSSWECRRESCPWNRRYRRSPGCSAPAATTAGLPQSLASLSSHWCLWKNQTGQEDISLCPSLPLLLLCILVVHASLLNRLWTGSRNRRAASSESLLWTCSMLCRVPPQETKPLHHLPLSCPCTSQFMFQENREKGAAVTTKLVLVEYYGNVSYGQKRSSSPTFYLIQASEFHFAVPGISHGTAGPARLKAGAQKKLRQTESVTFRRCFFPHQNQILKYLAQKDSSSPANGHAIFIKGYSLQEYVIQLYNAASWVIPAPPNLSAFLTSFRKGTQKISSSLQKAWLQLFSLPSWHLNSWGFWFIINNWPFSSPMIKIKANTIMYVIKYATKLTVTSKIQSPGPCF